jgi:hypothetical protein
MPKMTLATTLDRPPESPNANVHWGTRTRIRRNVRWELTIRAKAAQLPTGLQHITVTVHHRPANRRGIFDDGNRTAGFKAVFDALHDHRGIDNGPEHMTQRTVGHPPIKGRPAAVWVDIEWPEPAAEENPQ